MVVRKRRSLVRVAFSGAVLASVGVVVLVGGGALRFNDWLPLMDWSLMLLVAQGLLLLVRMLSNGRLSSARRTVLYLLGLCGFNTLWLVAPELAGNEPLTDLSVWSNYLALGLSLTSVIVLHPKQRRSLAALTSLGVTVIVATLLLIQAFFFSIQFLFILVVFAGAVLTYRLSSPSSPVVRTIDQLRQTLPTAETGPRRSVVISGMVLVTILGGILRLSNLGQTSFHHDEFFHVSAAVGLEQTGEYQLWDYINQTALRPYIRSSAYTWLVAQSFSLFGFSETSARLPGAIIGALIIPLIFLVFRKMLSPGVGLLAATIFAVYDPAIYLDRFTRGYAFARFFAFGMFWLFWLVYREWVVFQWTKKRLGRLTLLAVLLGAVSYAALHFGTLTVNLFFAAVLFFIGAVIYRTWRDRSYGHHRTILLGATAGLAVLVLVLNQLNILPILNVSYIFENQVEFFLDPENPIYFRYLFESFFTFPAVAHGFFVLGVFALFLRFRITGPYLVMTTMLVASFAVYGWARYEDFRYIDFLQPLAIGIMAVGLLAALRLGQYLVRLAVRPRWARHGLMGLTAAILFLLLVRIPTPTDWHLPATRTVQASWQTDEAQRIHRRAVAPKYREAYAYLDRSMKAGDAILATSDELGHYLYLKNPSQFSLFAFMRYSDTVIDLQDPDHGQIITADELFENQAVTWVVLDYPHLIGSVIIDRINEQCQNVSSEVPGNFQYNYKGSYRNRYYWPSVYRCRSVDLYPADRLYFQT